MPITEKDYGDLQELQSMELTADQRAKVDQLLAAYERQNPSARAARGGDENAAGLAVANMLAAGQEAAGARHAPREDPTAAAPLEGGATPESGAETVAAMMVHGPRMKKSDGVAPNVDAALIGADKTILGGFGRRLLAGNNLDPDVGFAADRDAQVAHFMEGQPTALEKRIRGVEEQNPGMVAAGATAGAFVPGGVAGRIGTAANELLGVEKAAGPLSGMFRGAGAAGLGAGGTEAVNATAEGDLEDLPGRALMSAAFGLPFGFLGGMFTGWANKPFQGSSEQARAMRTVRDNKGGFGFPAPEGVRAPESVQANFDEALLPGRPRPGDIATERVVPGLSARAAARSMALSTEEERLIGETAQGYAGSAADRVRKINDDYGATVAQWDNSSVGKTTLPPKNIGAALMDIVRPRFHAGTTKGIPVVDPGTFTRPLNSVFEVSKPMVQVPHGDGQGTAGRVMTVREARLAGFDVPGVPNTPEVPAASVAPKAPTRAFDTADEAIDHVKTVGLMGVPPTEGMRPESLDYLRAGGERFGGPPKVKVHMDGRVELVDGRHQLQVAQENGDTHMVADVFVEGPKGGILKRVKDVPLPIGGRTTEMSPPPPSPEAPDTSPSPAPGGGLDWLADLVEEGKRPTMQSPTAPSFDDMKVVITERPLTAEQLRITQEELDRISKQASSQIGPAPFERLTKAVRMDRDQYPWPAEMGPVPTAVLDDGTQVSGLSALAHNYSEALGAFQRDAKVLGLQGERMRRDDLVSPLRKAVLREDPEVERALLSMDPREELAMSMDDLRDASAAARRFRESLSLPEGRFDPEDLAPAIRSAAGRFGEPKQYARDQALRALAPDSPELQAGLSGIETTEAVRMLRDRSELPYGTSTMSIGRRLMRGPPLWALPATSAVGGALPKAGIGLSQSALPEQFWGLFDQVMGQ